MALDVLYTYSMSDANFGHQALCPTRRGLTSSPVPA